MIKLNKALNTNPSTMNLFSVSISFLFVGDNWFVKHKKMDGVEQDICFLSSLQSSP